MTRNATLCRAIFLDFDGVLFDTVREAYAVSMIALGRSARIVDDGRPEARAVLTNNIEILNLLTVCSEKAHDSTRVRSTLGTSQGPQWIPWIGGKQ